MARYTALAPFHHPDGVVCPGQTIDLDEQAAERGIASGTLVLAPLAPETVAVPPPPPPPEPGEPAPADPDPSKE